MMQANSNIPDAVGGGRPRVRVVSQRILHPRVSRCCGFEFEDAIVEMTNAQLLALRGTRSHVFLHKAGHHLARMAPVAPDGLASPLGRRRLENCDLLVVVCQFPSDLASLARLRGWRSSSGQAVCFVEEIWARQVARLPGHIRLLNRFDHVFTSCAGTVQALQERLDVPCAYLPPGVNARRFCPAEPGSPQRTIDVCNIGRRSPAAHALLRSFCASRGWFYYHDTYKPFHVLDPAEHRALLASIVQRTRYFVANRAKPDRLGETEGQEEIGFRYFEATAGGAVLIGDHPRTEEFDRQFGWEDAVIPAHYDGNDVIELIESLEASPQRVQAARNRNVAGALLRHDWAYRWMQILRGVGLEPSGGVVSRIGGLREQAARFTGGESAKGQETGAVADAVSAARPQAADSASRT